MSEAAAALPLERGAAVRVRVSVRTLTAALLSLFAIDNVLLLHFWGLPLSLAVGLGFVAGAAIWALTRRVASHDDAVPIRTLAIGFVISLCLLMLGGEGRLFYANLDWQIRDAVLRDLATNPWPFAYQGRSAPLFLRAPVGTYLLPAMFQAHAEVALLLSNAIRLTLIFGLGWQLFDRQRARVMGLALFILFSGWDAVGTALYSALGARVSWDHIEPWDFGYQYSSHVTQAFWVPQHAIAGWTCAILFLLWRKGLVPIGLFAAAIPLLALWSPLAMMGAVPFAAFAGIIALREKGLHPRDIGLALLGLVIAMPALLYLQVDATSVGMHILKTSPLIWLACIALEVLPFSLPLLLEPDNRAVDKPLVRLVQFLLLAMPLIQVGVSADFQMRASIMPLAILSVLFARWAGSTLEQRPVNRFAVSYVVVAVALGAVTPLLEVRRALVNEPSPPPLCSLVGVWDKQDGMVVPNSTYLAPVERLPAFLGKVPVTAGASDPEQCWDRQWVTPRHP